MTDPIAQAIENIAKRLRILESQQANTGSITSGLFAVMVEPTGFPNRTASTISFVDGTRTFTISPTGANFTFYSAGALYTKTATTKIITNTAGMHYIYFDTGGTIQESTIIWDINSANVPIAAVYWTGTTGYLFDERHGVQMDGQTHEYLHETNGSSYASGLGGTFAADGSTFQIDPGEWYDEDIEWAHLAAITQARIFYLNGSTWNGISPAAAYFYNYGGSPAFNNSGVLANVGVAKYSHSYFYISNYVAYPVIIIMGQAQYDTQAQAEAAPLPTLGSLPAAEMLLLYRITWQRDGSAITWKRTDDYRRVRGGSGVAYTPTDHGALSGLSDPDHYETSLLLSDNTTNNVTSTQHGFAPKSPAVANKFLDGGATPAWDYVRDNDIAFTDITTGNVDSTMHGFAPKSPGDATKFLDGGVTPAWDYVRDSDLSTSDIVTNDVSSAKHGFSPKSPADNTKFLDGGATPAFDYVRDSDLSTSDITTNNVTTSKHGFTPKAPNTVNTYLRGDATWATGREVLTAARTYYVRTDGSDSNTGLADTAGGAFLTIQKAVDTVASLDINAQTVTIQVRDGTFTGAVTLKNAVGFGSAGNLVIQGNSATPTNCVVSVTSNNAFTADGLNVIWDIKDMRIATTTSGSCLYAANGSAIRFSGIDFGSCANHHIESRSSSVITCTGNYTISGGCTYYHHYATGAHIYVQSRTITVTANITVNTFAYTQIVGNITATANTYSLGIYTVTGTRYYAAMNSAIQTNGGGASYFPGTVGGSTATGGQYA